MEAKRCDRCKKFYTKYDYAEEVKPEYRIYLDNRNGINENVKSEMRSVSATISWTRKYSDRTLYTGDMEENVNFDLCPQCATEVMKVLFKV